MTGARRRWVETGGPRLAVLEDGEPGAPTVVLVHGYPDNSSVWDGVAGELAGRFHVVRYDVRGHGASEAPPGRGGYRLADLAGDLLAVVQAVSPDEPVHLVGHDWGSIQCWAALDGGPFRSFTSISGPDLDQIRHWLGNWRRHPTKAARQALHSWYIGAFQVPVLPELGWRLPPLRARFGADYRDAANGLWLYRANMVGRPSTEPRRIAMPVQQLALTRDSYVTPALLEAADPWCDQLWRRPLPTAHWAPRTHPALVARLITEFVDHVDGAQPTRELARARVGTTRPPMGGQLAVVTGAGSGIGRATALALAAEGATVVCADIDLDAAERTAAEARGHAFRLDVTDGAATHRLAADVVAAHGVPDLVMANAGVAVAGPFLATDEADWRRVIDVNLWGVIHTLRAFLPPMVERGEGGHAVITSSAAGFLPVPSLPAYGTTKAGVLMLAQSLAGELAGHGIGVSAICPGFVHTNITATARFAGTDPDEERDRRAQATELYRRRGFGPENVAAAVVAAVRGERLVVPVTPEAKLAAIGMRFAPGAARALGRLIGRAST